MIPVIAAGWLTSEYVTAATVAGAALMRYGSRLQPLFNTLSKDVPGYSADINIGSGRARSALTALTEATSAIFETKSAHAEELVNIVPTVSNSPSPKPR